MLLAKLPWDPGGSLVWVGEIVEPKKDLRLLSRRWVSTIISTADAASLAGKRGKGCREVSSGEVRFL